MGGLLMDGECNVMENERLVDLVLEVFEEVENVMMKLIMW